MRNSIIEQQRRKAKQSDHRHAREPATMPSNRRLRAVLYAAFALVFIVIYLTSGARQARQHDFRSKTVDKMREKDAENEDIGQKMSDRLKEAEDVAKDTADHKLPYMPGKDEPRRDSKQAVQKDETEKRPAADKKPWVTMEEAKEEKDEQTPEEREVEAELGSILKRSPSKLFEMFKKPLRTTLLTSPCAITVIIFSKSYCPHSKRAKDILVEKYKIVPSPFVVELNEHPLGEQLQNALEKTTGRRTVPNVLVSGKSIGGGDDVAELDNTGQLIDKIRKMAGKRIMETNLRDSR
ncbi:MAG: hypothetical protein M1837_001397 [Sclerophora amabilis]|nr:MAG: hypothetical protein M1837_001397 [Sclerophora amabilis]